MRVAVVEMGYVTNVWDVSNGFVFQSDYSYATCVNEIGGTQMLVGPSNGSLVIPSDSANPGWVLLTVNGVLTLQAGIS